MKKFIFSLSEGVQVVIEAENFAGAQSEFEKTREEIASIKMHIVKLPVKKISRKGLYEYLIELKEGEFFSKPRTLREIKEKLSELALNYPTTTFPPYLNKLVREKILKRTKQNKDGKELWAYENGT